ncbi:MAG: VanW family protein [Clostridia bacterium]|nr:VanW family protein [Clostridia bacterium]
MIRKKFTSKVLLFLVLILIISLGLGMKWGYNHLNRKLNGVTKGVFLEGMNMEGYLPQEVRQIVELLALEQERKSQNAALNKKTGEIIPSKPGIAVDQERTMGLVIHSPGDMHLNLITYVVEPVLSTDDLAKITKVIGTYTTHFSGSPGRYQNIKIAMQTINNTLVMPNELFSFNLVTGPKTARKGYQLAPVIIGEGHTLGLGGGVCQVSSTLYNAARKSNMTIIERHAHSKPIRYVPPGHDAAIADGGKDLKFRNPYNYPIIIKASVQGGRIQVWILGKEGS